jgi:hypothetical protein
MEDQGPSPFRHDPAGWPPEDDASNPYQSPQAPIPRVYAPVATTRTSTEAVIAFVLSVCGMLMCFFPMGCLTVPLEVAAVVLAIVARNKISADPTLQGRGLATAGLVIAALVLAACLLLAAIMVILIVTGGP